MRYSFNACMEFKNHANDERGFYFAGVERMTRLLHHEQCSAVSTRDGNYVYRGDVVKKKKEVAG